MYRGPMYRCMDARYIETGEKSHVVVDEEERRRHRFVFLRRRKIVHIASLEISKKTQLNDASGICVESESDEVDDQKTVDVLRSGRE